MSKMLSIVMLLIAFASFVHGNPRVPCYFIFGDSLSDAGNNNALNTAAKSNYAPYGVDFPGGASGRFTNGRTFVDFLTELVGMQGFIKPFSTAMGKEILKGVNYASGSAGIRAESGSQLGDRIWMDRQLINHATIVAKLQFIVKGPVGDYLNKCLYTVNIGSNDYINNYFMPQLYPTKKLFTPDQYAQTLIDQYYQQLQSLYSLGARKIAVFGLGLIGCTPAEIVMNNANGCVDEINQAVQLFNQRLPSLVDDLNKKLAGAMFTFIDTAAMQIAAPPLALIINDTCCKLRSDFQCEPNIPPCLDRNLYAFMDGFHPTEAVNRLTASTAFVSPDVSFVHPIDINALVSA